MDFYLHFWELIYAIVMYGSALGALKNYLLALLSIKFTIAPRQSIKIKTSALILLYGTGWPAVWFFQAEKSAYTLVYQLSKISHHCR